MEDREIKVQSLDEYLGWQAGILGNSITEMKAYEQTYVCSFSIEMIK